MDTKRFALSSAGAVAVSVSGYAFADVTVSFDTGMITGLTTQRIQENLSGTLTGMDIAVNFYDSESSGVWASDFLVGLGDGLGANTGIEWGGFNASFGYDDGGSFSWSPSYGNYSASFGGINRAVSGGFLDIANGWTTSPGGAWSGSITLYGLNVNSGGGGGGGAAVPEPATCVSIVTGLAMATVAKRLRSRRTKRAAEPTNVAPLSDI